MLMEMKTLKPNDQACDTNKILAICLTKFRGISNIAQITRTTNNNNDSRIKDSGKSSVIVIL